MIRFLLNNESIETDLPAGTTVLDFVRYRKNLKGTKIGCREGDCGACTVITGELVGKEVRYRTMTSCLMPLANASGKHIVTVEGINPKGVGLTPVQSAIVENGGTQCGFCTVGFVMSLTAFCIDGSAGTKDAAVSAIDGNICRCTGYKSLETAAADLCQYKSASNGDQTIDAIQAGIVPEYFADVADKLKLYREAEMPGWEPSAPVVAGGTDLYVQKPDQMVIEKATHVFYSEEFRGIWESAGYIEIGASATVTDLLESELMSDIFPRLYDHLKLVSSTPIRNMATLGGNFVNASPIGDMTIWFLALDAELVFNTDRSIPLKE
ncbi:MAG: FAD binding domain-containing protein, partial [Acidobacteriota bacterium]|nr:FAD binding domain-containing protein [Acidobacteriota bacterium]